MIAHGRKQISEMVYARKASEGGGAVRLTNMIRGAQVVFGELVPKVNSPYSPAASVALKAAFPTQWPIIRDYGFAHPEIVPYVNAYATEDPKIAYSLVPTLGVIRKLCTDGTAYINTNIKPSSTTNVDTRMSATTSSNTSLFGARDTGSGGDGYCMQVIKGYVVSDYLTRINTQTFVSGKEYLIEKHGASVKVNNVQYTNTAQTFTTTQDLLIFGISYWDEQHPCNVPETCEFFDIDNKRLRPFICQARTADNVSTGVAQAAGTCGMIDLLTGIFYPNANSSGSFTISESPA